jgi:hypothetical protein
LVLPDLGVDLERVAGIVNDWLQQGEVPKENGNE